MTPRADVRVLSRFTPRMQTYCVIALAARFKICLGTVKAGPVGVRSRGPKFPSLVRLVELVKLGKTSDGW